MDALRYRGFTIRPHGRRWRCQTRPAIVRDTIEAVQAEIDHRLAERARAQDLRSVRERGGIPIGELVERWYWGPPDRPELGHQRKLQVLVQLEYERFIGESGAVGAIATWDARALATDNADLRVYLTATMPSPVQARRAYTILNQVFKAAMHGELGPEYRIEANPCAGIRLRSWKSAVKDIPTKAEVEKMIREAEAMDPKFGLWVKLTATFGLRRGETCALRWEDFDFAHQWVTIRRAAARGRGTIVVKPPKSGRSRTLHMPHRGFWAALEAIRQPSGYVFQGFSRRSGPRSTSLVVDPDRPWHPSSVSHRWTDMMKRLGLRGRDTDRPYGTHALRHYVATTLYNQVRDWVQLAKFLGHENPAITMQLYSNHVVEPTQLALGEAAAASWWDDLDVEE